MTDMIGAIGRATSYLPHRKVTLPHRSEREASLTVYLDSELGYLLDIYEPAVTSVLRRELDSESVFFDVGAHIGIYTVLGGFQGADVHAFEPNDRSFDRLRENIAQNSIQASVSNSALWEYTGNGSLSGETPETMSIEPDSGGDIQLQTLDEYVRDREVDVDLLKVDVEGDFPKVAAGAEDTIEEKQPTILVETHTDEERREIEQLVEAGYERETVDSNHVLLRAGDAK